MVPSLLDMRFLGLLTIVCLCRRFVPSRYFALFGAVSSAAIVGLASIQTLSVIGGITLLYLYPIHLISHWLKQHEKYRRFLRLLFIVGTIGLVGFMVGFKVYQHFTIPFFTNSFIDRQLQALIGFSYFLFRAINFLYMQHVVEVRLLSPATLFFYTLFPPTLTSGPIHKFLDFQGQLKTANAPEIGDYVEGLYRITRGFFRKLVLAYLLNEAIGMMLASTSPDFARSISITVFLYLYFYFDFAGYSDVAIGFGRLMGIKVPENFRKPFTASTLTEFWRHWHITLVDWLRDHVFIPLGGMRSSRARSSLLALLIMVLCGLWHGLTPNFLIWGILHGLHLLVEARLGIKPTSPSQRHGVAYWGKVAWTNARVAIAALLFLPNTADILFVLRGFLP